MEVIRRLLASTLSLALAILPISCRNRNNQPTSLQEDDAKLTQIQSELKDKLLEFFSAKVYPGWTFQLMGKNDQYVPVKLEELIDQPREEYQQFMLVPPASEKIDLAFQFKPVEINLDGGSVKFALSVTSKDLKKVKARNTLSINTQAENPEAEAAKLEEALKVMQSQIDGAKTGHLNKAWEPIFDFLVPPAYGAETTPLQRVFRVGANVGGTILIGSLIYWFFSIPAAGSKAKKITVGLVLGGLALAILGDSLEYVVYGTTQIHENLGVDPKK